MDVFKSPYEAQIAFDELMASDLYSALAHYNYGMSMVQGTYCNAGVYNTPLMLTDFANQMITLNAAPGANHASLNNKRKSACNLVPGITGNDSADQYISPQPAPTSVTDIKDTDGGHLARLIKNEGVKFHKKLQTVHEVSSTKTFPSLSKTDTVLQEKTIPSNGVRVSKQVNISDEQSSTAYTINNSSVQAGPAHNNNSSDLSVISASLNNKRKRSTCHSVPCYACITGNDSANQDSSYQAVPNHVLDKKDTDRGHLTNLTANEQIQFIVELHKKLQISPDVSNSETSHSFPSLNKTVTVSQEKLIPSDGALASKQVNKLVQISDEQFNTVYANNDSTVQAPASVSSKICINENHDSICNNDSKAMENLQISSQKIIKENTSINMSPEAIFDFHRHKIQHGRWHVRQRSRSKLRSQTCCDRKSSPYSKRVHACKTQSSEKSICRLVQQSDGQPKPMPEERTLEDKRTLDIQKDAEIVAIKNVESITASDEETIFGSLLNYLTKEQVKEHISSLNSKNTSENSNGSYMDVHCCTLCGLGERDFQLTSCSYCAKFIKDGAKCYRQDKYNIFCKGCSKNIDRKLLSTYNVEHEMWIQCETCCCWNHQICALYNNLKNKEKKAIHRCPDCYLKEIGSEEMQNIEKALDFEAKDLPRTEISSFIELRLSRRLEEDRKRRQEKSGNNNNEVPIAKDLVFREVSSLNKTVKVDESIDKVLLDDTSPKEFTYKSKVFLLFQKIEGVDICIFALFAQEYGSDCPPPNKGCVYLSYIDSVHYLRPRIQDADGKSYRSFVYHEILLGYMESCKKRNFNTLHLWAYPPDKKTIDFIFYSRPKEQKIPDKKQLLEWYQCLIDKAMDENIVVGKTNLFDKYFDPNERKMKMIISSKMRGVANKLPYFDGDYWPKLAQEIIYNIRHDARNKSFIEEKWMRDETIIKIYDQIHYKGAKDPLMMLQLQNCDATEEMPDKGDTHMMENNKVGLSEDVNISNPIVDTRTDFLNHCHEYHYQFDSIRNAKHSTMMLLYHLVKKELPEPD